MASSDPLIRLAAEDNVLVARRELRPGERIALGDLVITVREPVRLGFKLAAAPIAPGDRILKYGMPIGSATMAIEPGAVVHVHNMKSA